MVKRRELFPRIPPKPRGPPPATQEELKRKITEGLARAEGRDPSDYLARLAEDSRRLRDLEEPGSEREGRLHRIGVQARAILREMELGRIGAAVHDAVVLGQILQEDLLTRPHVKDRSVEWLAAYGLAQAGWLPQEIDKAKVLQTYEAHRAAGLRVGEAMKSTAAALGCSVDTVKRARGTKR